MHININYFDNPFVDEKILKEALISKEKNINDYNHIWLGYPMSNSSEFLVSSEAIDKSVNLEYFRISYSFGIGNSFVQKCYYSHEVAKKQAK